MRLRQLNKNERDALAKRVDSKGIYLYQCGLGIRKPSVELSLKINKADPRFSLPELRPDVWGIEP